MIAGATQWAIVGIVVAVCAAYALKVLLPRGARRGLAGWLARRGFVTAAARLDASGSACEACSGNGQRRARG